MITGPELLATLKRYTTATEKELAAACGYTKVTANGRTRTLSAQFYRAVLQAKGLLPDAAAPRGRKLSSVTKVHFNGNLTIGKAYTRMLGLQPGDTFQIDLSRDQIKLIHLKPANQDQVEACPAVCPAPVLVDELTGNPALAAVP
jgi:bifunctional DNA-binding transcriptional regulator/antitoxin component of YhaV-PrlF toxin-antitoxin module